MAKVLQLYNVFGATTERTMLEVPLALAERGHDLAFAAEALAEDAPPVAQGVRGIKRIHVDPTDDIDAQMRAIAAAPPAVDELFDLVHAHFGPRGLHASRYLVRGVPVVISTYGYDTSRLLRDPCWAARYRWLGEHGATFVALSEAMADTLRKAGVPPERIEVIPLGIALPRWDYRPQPGSNKFLFVGRFVEKKGAEQAIIALARCRQHGSEATLTMVGTGDVEMEQWLKHHAVKSGVADAVTFAGSVPYEALPGVMRDATALVAPSRTAADGDAEGCPMVLMQAQAVGTPVITTRHAGNPEALPDEGQRFVVPERDPEALAHAMTAMLALSAEDRAQLQAAGRRWIEERFDIQRTVERYDALYRRRVG